MPLSLGIVGLPNVGKSTLFNALARSTAAEASNYPFTTIEPNVGIVGVPDVRLEVLAAIVKPGRIVPAAITFTDIAGLVTGAASGEGLGNKFLAHIRETAAVVYVARFFDHPDIIHVAGRIDPLADLEMVELELVLADMETVTKALDRYRKEAKRGGEGAAYAASAEAVLGALELGKPARSVAVLDDADRHVRRELQLLTAKPVLIVANVSEQDASLTAEELYGRADFSAFIPGPGYLVPVCAKLEAELALLEPGEQAVFLSEYGLDSSALDRLITAAYSLLGLSTYFTAGEQEVRAWTFPHGATAPQAAGVIHTDFEKGFIRAETVAYADYVSGNGEAGAKEAGKLRAEGKEYVVKDGDIMHFRFSR